MAEPQIRPRSPEPSRVPVRTWPTPNTTDLLFYVERDGNLPVNQCAPGAKSWAYGDPYFDRVNYPNHKLVYVSPQSPEQWSRWYYAADRTHQDDYNYEIQADDRLVRTYVIPRADYPEKFPPLAVTTPDIKFPKYVFASEYLVDAGDELRSIFVAIQRVFSQETTIAYQYDSTVEREIKITRSIVPAGTVVGSVVAGKTIDVLPQNTFFDIKVTAEVVDFEEPTALETTPTYTNYEFPPRLDAVTCYGAWAWAASTGAPQSYSEDFFFENKFTEPALGPYSAKLLRFLTGDPDSIRALYPLDKVVMKRDTFGILKAWFNASTQGNSTFALARQFDVGRPCIHPVINLPANVDYTQGTSGQPSTVAAGGSATLPATPEFSTYMAKTTLTLSVATKKTAYGLWEVQVLQIPLGGSVESVIYGGAYTP